MEPDGERAADRPADPTAGACRGPPGREVSELLAPDVVQPDDEGSEGSGVKHVDAPSWSRDVLIGASPPSPSLSRLVPGVQQRIRID
jgi:hypothetical protein